MWSGENDFLYSINKVWLNIRDAISVERTDTELNSHKNKNLITKQTILMFVFTCSVQQGATVHLITYDVFCVLGICSLPPEHFISLSYWKIFLVLPVVDSRRCCRLGWLIPWEKKRERQRERKRERRSERYMGTTVGVQLLNQNWTTGTRCKRAAGVEGV